MLAIRTNKASSEIVLKTGRLFPAEDCRQNGDLPTSPLNDRQLLPPVGTIILNFGISLGT